MSCFKCTFKPFSSGPSFTFILLVSILLVMLYSKDCLLSTEDSRWSGGCFLSSSKRLGDVGIKKFVLNYNCYCCETLANDVSF